MRELYTCLGDKKKNGTLVVEIGIINKFVVDTKKSQKADYNRCYCGLTAFNSNEILLYTSYNVYTTIC